MTVAYAERAENRIEGGCELPVNIEKTAQSNASNPCTFTVTLSAEGSSTITGSPLYLVLVVDATSSQDLKN
jgi:hypothetical protein